MFEFKGVEAPQRLNRDFVLGKISDAMIMAYYHGEFKVGDVYSSKFRKDRKASCGFYISSSGKLIYNDMSTREKLDCFAFVQKLYNCDFKTAVQRVAQDFGLIDGFKTNTATQVMEKMKNFDRKHKKRTKIHFKAGRWTSENLAYWKAYHITKEELERENIFPIQTLFINEQFIPNKNDCTRYALTLQHKGEMLTKVLSPDGEDSLKWVSSIPLDIPFGMDTLPFKSDFSFGAKAGKDRLVLMKFLSDVYATQNETKSALSKKVVTSLFFNYDRNYLGWDPDETGLEGMAEMAQEGFIPAHVPVKTFQATNGIIKDWADVAKEKGLGGVEKLLKFYKLI